MKIHYYNLILFYVMVGVISEIIIYKRNCNLFVFIYKIFGKNYMKRYNDGFDQSFEI